MIDPAPSGTPSTSAAPSTPPAPSPAQADTHAPLGGEAPAPEISSGEATPWEGDPGFPVVPGRATYDPRWLRKGIPRWLHWMLFCLWALFVLYILFLFFFHTPGAKGFMEHPPPGVTANPNAAPGKPQAAPPPNAPATPATPATPTH
ncbi:MAG: hypothetical protein ACREJ2_08485 [Planctomycetota bacterium]